MSGHKCNSVKRYLCKLVHKKLCDKKSICEEIVVKEERPPLFVKNKSGRWIHRASGKFVRKEVAEAYVNNQR